MNKFKIFLNGFVGAVTISLLVVGLLLIGGAVFVLTSRLAGQTAAILSAAIFVLGSVGGLSALIVEWGRE